MRGPEKRSSRGGSAAARDPAFVIKEAVSQANDRQWYSATTDGKKSARLRTSERRQLDRAFASTRENGVPEDLYRSAFGRCNRCGSCETGIPGLRIRRLLSVFLRLQVPILRLRSRIPRIRTRIRPWLRSWLWIRISVLRRLRRLWRLRPSRLLLRWTRSSSRSLDFLDHRLKKSEPRVIRT